MALAQMMKSVLVGIERATYKHYPVAAKFLLWISVGNKFRYLPQNSLSNERSPRTHASISSMQRFMD
jgi:hypothetical protein